MMRHQQPIQFPRCESILLFKVFLELMSAVPMSKAFTQIQNQACHSQMLLLVIWFDAIDNTLFIVSVNKTQEQTETNQCSLDFPDNIMCHNITFSSQPYEKHLRKSI